jgi:cell division septal protein FtsQ
MRDLHHRPQHRPVRNRSKKQKKERKPINFRRYLKKTARYAAFLTLVGVVSVVIYEAWELLSKTTFVRLERVEVKNLKRLKRQDILAQAGVSPGQGMLRLNLRRIAEQVKKNPWVEKVQVRRYYPHTLSIEIVEWEPAAVLNMGYLFYIDRKGDIFKPLNVGDNVDFPVVTGISEEDLSRDPAGTKATLKAALDLMNLIKAGKTLKLEDVSEIHADKGYGLTVFTARGGVPIKFGNDGFGEKLARLSKIYPELSAQLPGIQYVDLNYTDKIVVKKV